MLKLLEHLEGKKHVIWDWNGTLLNDVREAVRVINLLLVEHGKDPISLEDYREVFCFPIVEYYSRLGFEFERVPFAVLADRFVVEYKKVARHCGIYEGAETLLSTLQKQGVSQSILSAAHEEHLVQLLQHYGLRDYFDRVFALSDHHATSKVERGRELLGAAGFGLHETILVGDTDHDLEVGRALGVDVLLLGDGHQASSRLTSIHDRVLTDR